MSIYINYKNDLISYMIIETCINRFTLTLTDQQDSIVKHPNYKLILRIATTNKNQITNARISSLNYLFNRIPSNFVWNHFIASSFWT